MGSFVCLVLLCFLVAPCCGSLFGSSDDTPVGRFKAYLRIATVHPVPDYKPPADFLLAQAKEIGLESQLLEYVEGKPVTLLTWKGTNPSLPSILLNSHVDVVPAEKTKWVHEPFSATEVFPPPFFFFINSLKRFLFSVRDMLVAFL